MNGSARKRIWEIDCWSLDSAIAASFGWQELINILRGNGHQFDLKKAISILELRAQALVHEYCHSENSISLRIENLLNDWHKKFIEIFDGWTPAEVAEHILSISLNKQLSHGGLFWALASDSREGFDCLRRRFHQRFQIFSIRHFKSQSAMQNDLARDGRLPAKYPAMNFQNGEKYGEFVS